jgi:hypothetical protein
MYEGWFVLAYVPIATKTEEVDKRKYASKGCSSDGDIAKVVSCRGKRTVASSKRSDRLDQWKELEKEH